MLTCQVCGVEFYKPLSLITRANGGVRKYCSMACYNRTDRNADKRGVPKTEEAKRKLSENRERRQRGATHWHWQGGGVQRLCLHCGATFVVSNKVPKALRPHKQFCAAACWNAWRKTQARLPKGLPRVADAAQRQRARRAGAAVVEVIDRGVIIERDGSICYLCNATVDDDEIELDHVVPLSRGGVHTADNLRVTHRRCNRAKCAKLLSEMRP